MKIQCNLEKAVKHIFSNMHTLMEAVNVLNDENRVSFYKELQQSTKLNETHTLTELTVVRSTAGH
jgi:predicted acetyltransferase